MSIKPLQTDIQFLRDTIYGLTEQIDLLTILQDISKGIVSGFDFEEIISKFLDIVKEIINYKYAALFIYNRNSREYTLLKARQGENVFFEEKNINRPDKEIIKWVFKEKRWISIPPSETGSPEHERHSILPLQGTQEQIGFLLIISDAGDSIFNKTNQTILSFIADQTAIAIENQNLYSRLDRSKKHIANIVESINSGIITIDMSDNITLVNKNATAMLAIQSADLTGKNYRTVLSRELVTIINNLKSRLLEDGFVLEKKFEHNPFRDFAIRLGITASLITDEKDETTGIIFIFRDMMASKEIQRLTQLDELKNEFVSNVSHELRTPLSIIKSYVEAILDQVEPDDHETQRDFLSVINEETDRLTLLVNDLLDISRIESGKFELTLTSVLLSDVIYSVTATMGKRDSRHKIITKIPSNLPVIYADRDKVTQVIINLLNNAIKFSPEGGTIEINVVPEKGKLWCHVSDQGIGIDQENLHHIFDKFFRVDNSDKYEIAGTGLGLPIVKHIMESHGGDITVKSESGKGSVFSIGFPCNAVDDENET
ncbi:putative Histidine kinase [Desulfamplus magnetovallimortis]|uniref:histidine kinase n=1 Tax=Desulfamplus magnetovallimortis TaxID=1246637 RepID=A0A1W1H737_9BACT|nr:ATP-binding protein [Desulfamplus magnetovallimortis]SLM28291.1 putative Histidine kinase [Desulfamplus magnetovallimortis]